jgi:NADH-quinone oxidoreductase subunit C
MIICSLLELIDVNLIVSMGVRAVDYLERFDQTRSKGVGDTRFVCALNMLGLSQEQWVGARARSGDEQPEVDSLFGLYSGTEAMEREAFDLFGILFTNHPDLTRILMPEEWEGHPPRQDYGRGRVPVQFKESPGPG